ncbi:substrate-binding domain-containing protein [Candidatus Halobeggiatoa sp. HSG11]|nr:substrate-binding domain-containing protein [Candidatus Halobeggiatoa sp. HSG11]
MKKIILLIFYIFLILAPVQAEENLTKKLAYIVSDTRIPFWDIMKRGIQNEAMTNGYNISVYSAKNDRKNELIFTAKVLKEKVDGIIISPTSSSACTTIIKLANKAGIPVVIADIGTDGGKYVSYISSNNLDGAYKIGQVLGKKMDSLGWKNGSVGIVAIPQKRLNGQARTAGFMKAMDEAGIKGAGIKQQSTWTEEETYTFSMEMIQKNSDLRAIWLQGSDRYNGALRAIADSNKTGDILLLTFDAEPEFIEMIQNEVILGSAMQQPYLMGQEAVRVLDEHLKGEKVPNSIVIPIMAISKENISEKLPIIRKNVLGMEDKKVK